MHQSHTAFHEKNFLALSAGLDFLDTLDYSCVERTEQESHEPLTHIPILAPQNGRVFVLVAA
jgi:hypothetical protein